MEGVRVAGLLGGAAAVMTVLRSSKENKTYEELKNSEMLRGRRRVKHDVKAVLKGWVKNTGDDAWSLEE